MVVSVTGHRDLVSSEICEIEKVVKEFLSSLEKNGLIVYSALAEGADILVARVAKELGIELKVILPYNKAEYIHSFSNIEAVDEFNSLLNYANSVDIVCNHTVINTTECYELLGKELCKRCDILLALWDGVDNGKKGGTSDVVKYFNKHFTHKILKVVKVNRRGL